MTIIFYKAEGKIFDRLIRWWTDSPYSHCELVFDGDLLFSADAWSNRVRFKTGYNRESWDEIALELNDAHIDKIMKFCAAQANAKYDWLGIAGFVIPAIKDSSDRWFCSELCCAALQQAGMLQGINSGRVSPKHLYQLLGGAL